MVSLINKQLLLTAYAYLFIMEQQKFQQGSEALQIKGSGCEKQTPVNEPQPEEKKVENQKGKAQQKNGKQVPKSPNNGKQVPKSPNKAQQNGSQAQPIPKSPNKAQQNGSQAQPNAAKNIKEPQMVEEKKADEKGSSLELEDIEIDIRPEDPSSDKDISYIWQVHDEFDGEKDFEDDDFRCDECKTALTGGAVGHTDRVNLDYCTGCFPKAEILVGSSFRKVRYGRVAQEFEELREKATEQTFLSLPSSGSIAKYEVHNHEGVKGVATCFYASRTLKEKSGSIEAGTVVWALAEPEEVQISTGTGDHKKFTRVEVIYQERASWRRGFMSFHDLITPLGEKADKQFYMRFAQNLASKLLEGHPDDKWHKKWDLAVSADESSDQIQARKKFLREMEIERVFNWLGWNSIGQRLDKNFANPQECRTYLMEVWRDPEFQAQKRQLQKDAGPKAVAGADYCYKLKEDNVWLFYEPLGMFENPQGDFDVGRLQIPLELWRRGTSYHFEANGMTFELAEVLVRQKGQSGAGKRRYVLADYLIDAKQPQQQASPNTKQPQRKSPPNTQLELKKAQAAICSKDAPVEKTAGQQRSVKQEKKANRGSTTFKVGDKVILDRLENPKEFDLHATQHKEIVGTKQKPVEGIVMKVAEAALTVGWPTTTLRMESNVVARVGDDAPTVWTETELGEWMDERGYGKYQKIAILHKVRKHQGKQGLRVKEEGM